MLSRQHTLETTAIFFVSLVLFTLGFQRQEIVGFEARFYLFALEMWRHGATWFPTTYQQYYPDYPVTSTWLIYVLARMSGGLNKWIAVLPSACAASVTVAMTYLIGTLRDRRVGMAAVCFLMLTATFVMEARTISLDQYTTAITVSCFYLVYAADLRRIAPPFLSLAVLLALGFLFRGPIGLIIPAGVLVGYYGVMRQFKCCLTIGAIATLCLLFCTALLLMIAYHIGGNHFVHDVLQMQVIGRMQVNQTPPWYFYLTESVGAYAITYPLLLLFLYLSRKRLLTQDGLFLQLLLAWVVIIFTGMSIPADKKVRYILPIAPALALFCAEGYVRIKQCRITYLAIVAIVFFLTVIFVAEPINLKLNRTRDFVLQVEANRHQQDAQLAFFQEGSDGLPIKYLVNMPQEERPIFAYDADEITRITLPTFFIARPEHLPTTVPITVLFKGNIGHDKVVVFIRQIPQTRSP